MLNVTITKSTILRTGRVSQLDPQVPRRGSCAPSGVPAAVLPPVMSSPPDAAVQPGGPHPGPGDQPDGRDHRYRQVKLLLHQGQWVRWKVIRSDKWSHG